MKVWAKGCESGGYLPIDIELNDCDFIEYFPFKKNIKYRWFDHDDPTSFVIGGKMKPNARLTANFIVEPTNPFYLGDCDVMNVLRKLDFKNEYIIYRHIAIKKSAIKRVDYLDKNIFDLTDNYVAIRLRNGKLLEKCAYDDDVEYIESCFGRKLGNGLWGAKDIANLKGDIITYKEEGLGVKFICSKILEKEIAKVYETHHIPKEYLDCDPISELNKLNENLQSDDKYVICDNMAVRKDLIKSIKYEIRVFLPVIGIQFINGAEHWVPTTKKIDYLEKLFGMPIQVKGETANLTR